MLYVKQGSVYTFPLPDIIDNTNHSAGLAGQTGTCRLTKLNSSAGTVSNAASTNNIAENDSTNNPGQYRLTLTATETNTLGFIMVYYKSAGSDPVSCIIKVGLADFDDGVRGGYTALPNAAAEAAGGLFTRGTGAGQINQDGNGRIDINLKAILGTVLTETAGLIAAGFKQFFNVATPTGTLNVIPRVTLTDTLTTYTGNTPQTGDGYARLGAPAGASVSADIATKMATYTQPAGFLATTFPSGTVANTTNITAGTITTVTNLTNAPISGDFTATMKTSLNASTPATTLSGTQSFNNTGQTANLPAQVKGMDANTLTASALATDAVDEIVAGLAALVVDGTITLKQCLAIQLAIGADKYTASAIVAHIKTVTYYRQDTTTPIATASVTYNPADDTTITGRTTVLSNLP